MPRARVELAGKQFGKLLVKKRLGRKENGDWLWRCKCECGKSVVFAGHNLRPGRQSSCGVCSKTGRRPTHGMEATPTYNSWAQMIQRCINPKSQMYYAYGARGISVCSRWRSSFSQFFADMGEKPEGFSLDRINNDGNYEPSNCRWTSSSVQMRNRRTTRFLTIDGDRKPAAEWAELYGVKRKILEYRLRNGWDVKRALETKNRKAR